MLGIVFLAFVHHIMLHDGYSFRKMFINFPFYCSGYQISVVLWGERATIFYGEAVLQSAQKEPAIVIFVGTLVKPFDG
jgi:hypothetical protein